MDELLKVERSLDTIASEVIFYKRQVQATVLNGAIEIGRRLAEAKAIVAHGEWGGWLKDKCDFSQSTANNMMRIFEEYGDSQLSLLDNNPNSQTFGNLSYSKALALLALPEEEREEFIENNNVEHMSTRDLQHAIKKVKELEEIANNQLQEIEKLDEEKKSLGEKYLEEKKVADFAEQELNKARNEIKSIEDKVKAEFDKKQKDLNNQIAKLQKELAEKEAEADNEPAPVVNDSLSEDEKEKVRQEAISLAKQDAEREKAELSRKIEGLQKQLSVSQSPDLLQFKFIFENFQSEYNKLSGIIEKVKISVNEETCNKLKNALVSALNQFTEKLGAVSFNVAKSGPIIENQITDGDEDIE